MQKGVIVSLSPVWWSLFCFIVGQTCENKRLVRDSVLFIWTPAALVSHYLRLVFVILKLATI